MSRLIVVSNRVPDLSNLSRSGGLAVAISDLFRTQSGLWIGWDGRVVEEAQADSKKLSMNGSVQTLTLPLTQKEYDGYYAGFSNSVLWPIFHYRLDLADFREPFLQTYRHVNAKFADTLAEILRDDDVIWVHDYHLIPLASELRKRGCKQKIGFFLHIPVPPLGILSAAPEHDWLCRSLFEYDLAGFQTQTDADNFASYVTEAQKGSRIGEVLRCFNRSLRIGSFPIGIDVDSFAKLAASPRALKRIEGRHQDLMKRTHFVGVDRLDYSKGLPERFQAFRRFLELNPDRRHSVCLLQIAPPTRGDVEAYRDIRDELEALTGSINGQFGDFNWTPLKYIHRNVPRETLAAIYRNSAVGLVTPLRDGMNLVAKEYVAAQAADDPGVLILSQFAGAAAELNEALIVNPYNTDDVAQALRKAVDMPRKERKERHAALLRRIKQNDIHEWHRRYFAELNRAEFGLAA